ncbi:hypothetical protein QTO34_000573 [Cnephaeus nilssonii]|uniref:RNase H type-1 domain-containing protein n=1 Tax=Cnephaeus nilssonii TaxID=3371016 RepID=A0AA40IBT3_CNENI|nr:hypothetical protein QTO34_000573 [Eptesicus nilssonii]
MVRGKGIKNQNEILKLLEAVWEPKELAVIYCREHQKGKDSVSEGNHRADTMARLAAKEGRCHLRTCWFMNYLNLQNTPLKKKNGPNEKGIELLIKKGIKEEEKMVAGKTEVRHHWDIRMFKRLDDKYTQLNENYKELNENVTNMKRNQEEMRNDIAAIKNTIEGLNSRLEEAEDCIR